MCQSVCKKVANIGSTKFCKIGFITRNLYSKRVARNKNKNNNNKDNNIDMSGYQSVFVSHCYVHIVSLHAATC